MYEPDPSTSLIQPGEECPGAGGFGNDEHRHWFDRFEMLRAYPAAASGIDDMPARDAAAMLILEDERRYLEQSQEYERMNERASKVVRRRHG